VVQSIDLINRALKLELFVTTAFTYYCQRDNSRAPYSCYQQW
jgi:hypothetical protein